MLPAHPLAPLLRKKRRLPGSLLMVLGMLLLLSPSITSPAQAQLPDTTATTPDSIAARLELPEDHSPRGALWRAAAVPGWGQYYNRQYLKMPVVYLALGGIIAAAVYNWDRYLLYRNAWRFRRTNGQFMSEEEYEGEFGGEKYEAAYLELVNQIEGVNPGEGLPTSVRSNRDQFHRWRDLSLIGSGLLYALQIVDAYVSAHLLGFEVGEELSLRATPRRAGLAATLRLSF